MILHEIVCIIFLCIAGGNRETCETCLHRHWKRVTYMFHEMPLFGHVSSNHPKKSITIHHIFQPHDCRFCQFRATKYHKNTPKC